VHLYIEGNVKVRIRYGSSSNASERAAAVEERKCRRVVRMDMKKAGH
jgi:hypothetical protein